MSKSTIEVTPKTMFGYALFFLGLILLGYTAVQCFFLANGAIEPLKVEFETIQDSEELAVFLGIILQIGMYALIIVISFILMKTGLSISRT